MLGYVGTAQRPARIHRHRHLLVLRSCDGCSCYVSAARTRHAARPRLALNPEAQRDLSAHGRLFAPGFLLLSAALLGAGFGWFKRRLWGWRLAIFIVATQVAGGLAHVLTGYVAKGIVGTIIPGALLFYLLRPGMKAAFGPND